MFTLACLYMPVLMDVKNKCPQETEDGRRIVMHVVSSSPKECRERAAEMMGIGVTWKDLFKKGWRIKLVEIVGSEPDFYDPEDFMPY